MVQKEKASKAAEGGCNYRSWGLSSFAKEEVEGTGVLEATGVTSALAGGVGCAIKVKSPYEHLCPFTLSDRAGGSYFSIV
jgi:hypothetical protein